MLTLAEDSTELCGWKKSSSGSEVDFIVKWKGIVIPFECKAALAIKNNHLSGLRDYMDIYNAPLGVVVSLAALEVRKLSKKHRILLLPPLSYRTLEGNDRMKVC